MYNPVSSGGRSLAVAAGARRSSAGVAASAWRDIYLGRPGNNQTAGRQATRRQLLGTPPSDPWLGSGHAAPGTEGIPTGHHNRVTTTHFLRLPYMQSHGWIFEANSFISMKR